MHAICIQFVCVEYKHAHVSVLETSFEAACVGVPCMNCVGVTGDIQSDI